MEQSKLKSLLESLIFVAEQPLKTAEMLKALQTLERKETQGEEDETDAAEEGALSSPKDVSEQLADKIQEEEETLSKADITAALGQLAEDYQNNPERGIILVEVAGGWHFRTRPENAAVIRYFYQPKPTRLSKPGLETLSILAYRQPITRVEIDEIRGVDSGGVLKTLLEKNLIRIVGKKDEPGKPMLYGTTQEFLELFQLKSLKDLPTLRDYRDLEEEFRKQNGEEGVVTEVEEAAPEEESSILDLADDHGLQPLSEDEEGILDDLEENIKEVRKMEKDIFAEEKPQGESPQSDSPSPPPGGEGQG